MIQQLRSSKILYTILILVTLSLVNLSIDPPNLVLSPGLSKEHLSDESESISELILENILDCTEIFPDLPNEHEEDEHLSKKIDFAISCSISFTFKNKIIRYEENLTSQSSLLYDQFNKKPTAPPPWTKLC